MRNALAELAMRLVDPDDREEFRKADGVTALVDHLVRHLEEQASQNYTWTSSQVFGTTWGEVEVRDSLQLTLVALCHASIDSDIAAEMNDLGALDLLFQVLQSLPLQLNNYTPSILENLRNLCGSDSMPNALPPEFVPRMWDIVLKDTQASGYQQEVAAEVLANIAAIEATLAAATPEKLAGALSLFLRAARDPNFSNLGIAIADLLCNLCCDSACCLLLICELDTRRPRNRMRHSGVVYLAELTDQTTDDALKQSMEALVHNLSWSDPAGKRCIQKLALSSYMNRFALDPAV
ncbi:hypothetical protein PHYBOEH_009881 [Phytophthora boehmeriae]|uniref:Uncharacterized protein n=1 Tax=Phytophthora boehmeriae TaxID=109152 RepID=A0A8T1VTW3_9STRA|nr:hypothetical protein PHYBOEH_009881 [Phytophthora boehmeriae]